MLFTLIGITLFFIQYFRKDPAFAKFAIETTYKPPRVKNPYEGLSGPDISTIASNISRNLTSLGAIYGILLSFVIAAKIGIAFQSWVFYIWAGLILSMIVRSLLLANTLSEIAYRSTIPYKQKIATILTSRAFLKHSAYLFIAIIAFTPAFALINSNGSIEDRYSYLGDYLILTVAVSVIVVTIFFIYVASSVPGSTNIFYLWTLGPLILVTLFLTHSPLEPVQVKFFSDSVFVFPFIILPVVFSGVFFSIVVIPLVAHYYADSLYHRLRKNSDV